MIIIKRKEIEAVLQLPGERRYRYFIKRVADASKLWGLWNDGWATGITDDGQQTMPVWPAPEYADLCRLGDWKDYTPKDIELHYFMEEFLPNLIREGVRVSIFDTPSEDTVIINDSELIDDLKEELSKME